MIKINQFFFELNLSTQKRIITYHKKGGSPKFWTAAFFVIYMKPYCLLKVIYMKY